jgi:integrase
MESMLLDVAGHRRSPATMPGYHRGRPPRNKGEQYPVDPPTVEEIVAVMRTLGDADDGHRLRALIVLLLRAGLRISEALSLQESDLDGTRGAVLVRRGKGGKRREVGMDRWAWEQLDPWLEIRRGLPIGALLCVIHGPTAGRRWEASAARKQLHHAAVAAGVRRRFAPHQLRHAHAVEMAHEGVPLVCPECTLVNEPLFSCPLLRDCRNDRSPRGALRRPRPNRPLGFSRGRFCPPAIAAAGLTTPES